MSDPAPKPLPKTETATVKPSSKTVRSTKTSQSKIQVSGFGGLGHFLVGLWAVSAAIATGTQTQTAQMMERNLQTLFFELRGPVLPPADVVILGMDVSSVAQGRLYATDPKRFSFLEPLQTSPPKRTAYAIALDRVLGAGARTVSVDVVLDLPSGHGEADDQRLQKVLQKYPNRVTLAAMYDDVNNQTSREGDLTQLTTPNPLFESAAIGVINFPIAPNGKIHSLGSQYLNIVAQTYADPELAKVLQETTQAPAFADATLKAARLTYPPPKGEDIFFYGPTGTFPQVPLWQVLDPETWKVHQQKGTFKNKIVLLGPTADVYQDFHAAPFSKTLLNPNPLTGIEIHANAIASLLENRTIAPAIPSAPLQGLLALILVVAAGYIQSQPKRSLFRFASALGLAFAWSCVGYISFVHARLILPTALPMTAIALSGVSYFVTQSAKEYRWKRQLRKILGQYPNSDVVQRIIHEDAELQDLLQEPDQMLLEKRLAGRYQITGDLGAGGFGKTYLAEDRQRPGNPVCVVKQLKPVSDNPNLLTLARRLFRREAQTLEKLGKHDQIPQLLAYFEEEGEFYLVQEFIVGQPLNQELSLGRQMPESKVVGIVQELLQILEFVHEHKVIHRDIKPSNIIRRHSDRHLVLIDFGAVKDEIRQTVDDDAVSGMTVGIGTKGYMPNEQCAGKPRQNSDVYAVGIIGIEALTGLPPSQLKDDPYTGEILWRHKAKVSHALADVLSMMVRYDYRKRYQTATEALTALRELVGTAATPALPLEYAAGSGTIPMLDNNAGTAIAQNTTDLDLVSLHDDLDNGDLDGETAIAQLDKTDAQDPDGSAVIDNPDAETAIAQLVTAQVLDTAKMDDTDAQDCTADTAIAQLNTNNTANSALDDLDAQDCTADTAIAQINTLEVADTDTAVANMPPGSAPNQY